MKTKIKVIKEDEGFVGYLLANDEIFYKTIPYPDAASASNALTQYANNENIKARLQKNKFKLPFELNPILQKQLIPTITPNNTSTSGRSCCGRG